MNILSNTEMEHGRSNFLNSSVAALSDNFSATEAVLGIRGVASGDEDLYEEF